MKFKHALLSLTSLSILMSAQVSSEEYRYIDVPVPSQVADLADNDKDGVINARDKCENTALGAEVDNNGCGTQIKSANEMQLKILFPNASSTINSVFVQEITNMVSFLKKYPQTSVELQGYASKVGNTEYNMALSKQRANNVKDQLISSGIDSSRVTIVGFGDTSVENTEDSELAHALNRKVTATVVGYDDKILREWNIFSKRNH